VADWLQGDLKAVMFNWTPAHLMVDELLATYSEAARQFCQRNGATLPLVSGTVRGKADPARFATAPLRRYVDMLAQQQITHVLAGEEPLSKEEIVERMTWINWQRSTSQRIRDTSRNRVLLEAFANLCASKARLAGVAIVKAVAVGMGTEVRLPDAGVYSHVKMPPEWKPKSRMFDLPEGLEFDVEVIRVDPLKGTVELVFKDPEGVLGGTRG
jgi:hypothetical protein